jgi:proline racemase
VDTTFGPVTVDIGFGGAFYAHLDVATVGRRVSPADLPSLVALGREVKWALNDTPYARHPVDSRLDGIYGTVLYEDAGLTPAGELHQRNVAVFADGEVDRSPCGSGTASRVAVLAASGRLEPRQALLHDSIVGSRFRAVVDGRTTVAGVPAVLPVVTGRAHRTGEHTFVVDDDDDLAPGFLLS